MKEFNYSSYATIYSAIVPDGGLNIHLANRACFARVFNWFTHANAKKYTASYKVVIYRGTKRIRAHRESNACLLSHEELRNHINQLKDIIPFKCKIRKRKEGDYSTFDVSIEVINGTIIQHKYILAWIRYAYEYPFNVTLKEANRLRHEKEFKFMSGFNLFNLVGQCFNIWGAGHAIAHGNFVKLMSKSNLKKLLETENRLFLNDIFECSHERVDNIERRSTIKDHLSATDIEFWDDDNLYVEERLPVYKNRLKDLKRL